MISGRGEEDPVCDPGSELLPATGRERESGGRIINGMKKNN